MKFFPSLYIINNDGLTASAPWSTRIMWTIKAFCNNELDFVVKELKVWELVH